MSIKSRMKSYSFWVSLASAIFIFLKLTGQSLGFDVDENLFNDIFTSLCGILVICGIIAPPTGNEKNLLPAPTVAQSSLILSEQQSEGEELENAIPSDENTCEKQDEFDHQVVSNQISIEDAISSTESSNESQCEAKKQNESIHD